MTNKTVLEKYVRSPVPVLPESQFKYYNEELKKIEQALGGLFSAVRSTGPYIQMPYGTLISTSDQTAASTTAAYPITYSSVGAGSGVTYQSGSQIKVTHAGVYNLQFSLQLVSTANEPYEVDVWLRKNGVDVANTNSVFFVPAKKSSAVSGHLIAALNHFVEIGETDYVELVWHTASTDVTIEHLPAKTGPVIPATPSVIVTLDYLSGVV